MPLAFGFVAFAIAWCVLQALPNRRTDWEPLWHAARAAFEGRDAYRENERIGWPFPMYYPGPALLVSLPFTVFAVRLASLLWIGSGTAVLAWAIQRGGPKWRWWMLLSGPSLSNIVTGNWAAWLTAGLLIPALGGVVACKPSTGAALFLSRPSKRMVGGAIVLCVASLLLVPTWPLDWLHAISDPRHLKAPAFRPWGFVLLLAALRWRTWQGRLLLGLALIPQSGGALDALPLLLLAPTAPFLAIWSAVSAVAWWLALDGPGPQDLVIWGAHKWPYWFVTLYLPALWCVLRPPALTAPAPCRPEATSAPTPDACSGALAPAPAHPHCPR